MQLLRRGIFCHNDKNFVDVNDDVEGDFVFIAVVVRLSNIVVALITTIIIIIIICINEQLLYSISYCRNG